MLQTLGEILNVKPDLIGSRLKLAADSYEPIKIKKQPEHGRDYQH